MRLTWKLSASVAAVLLLAGGSAVKADTAVINFTTDLTSYEGASALDPFETGTITNDLINGVGGFFGAGSADWTKFTGQIYIPDFSGDGTYTITPDNNAGGIYLHSPLLNRIEAVSLRTEGPLTAASLAAGAGRVDGAATQNRDDIYLPDFTPNGVATVTIAGASVSIDYLLDFSTLPITNAQFLRNGDTRTDISDALESAGSQFVSIGVNGSGDAVTTTATIGVDDQDIPYGGYYLLDPAVGGNLGNTIVPTTRGILADEIAANNISSDGRSATNPDTVFLTDPFAGESGTVTFFDLTGGQPLGASVVTTVPEPSALFAAFSGVLAAVARRRRS